MYNRNEHIDTFAHLTCTAGSKGCRCLRQHTVQHSGLSCSAARAGVLGGLGSWPRPPCHCAGCGLVSWFSLVGLGFYSFLGAGFMVLPCI